MKVSALMGCDLDYWVAQHDPRCRGLSFSWRDAPSVGRHWVGISNKSGDSESVIIYGCEHDWEVEFRLAQLYRPDTKEHAYQPSWKWEHGGPIIERENISITYSGHYSAWPWFAGVSMVHQGGCGETPLIAAMRAYVAIKYGDEVPEIK